MKSKHTCGLCKTGYTCGPKMAAIIADKNSMKPDVIKRAARLTSNYLDRQLAKLPKNRREEVEKMANDIIKDNRSFAMWGILDDGRILDTIWYSRKPARTSKLNHYPGSKVVKLLITII